MAFDRAVCAVAALAFSASAMAQVPEIPDPTLPDIAMVRMMNGQPVIIYNPMICQQIGPFLCGFYRKHEYCHIYLSHPLRQMWPQAMEFEADCCAAKHVTDQEFAAAFQFFMGGGGGTPQHGPGPARAARIRDCRFG
jgi:hypothetical protein